MGDLILITKEGSVHVTTTDERPDVDVLIEGASGNSYYSKTIRKIDELIGRITSKRLPADILKRIKKH